LKKQRVDDSRIVDPASITSTLLHECKLLEKTTTKNNVLLQIRTDDVTIILNNGTTEFDIPSFTSLVGFGKGAFKLIKDTDPLPPGAIEYKLTNQDELVMLGNVVQPIGRLLIDQLAKKPDTKLSYHNFVQHPADPRLFDIKQTHRIVYVPSAATESAVSNTNLGCKQIAELWDTDTMRRVWQLRATAGKGLQVACCKVVSIVDIKVPPNKACIMTKVKAASASS
jgi:hypothetical protein